MPPFIDQFDRADNAGSLGAPWTVHAGQWFDDVTLRDSFGVGALKFNSSATAFFDGAIAHIQVLSSQLSTGDRTAYHGWVTAHYGIAVA